MQTVLIVFHVLTAVAMVAIVLVQRGAGATAGAAFGAGASATVFGSRGSGSFLTRATAILATGFFLISLTLAVLAARMGDEGNDDLGIMSNVTVAPESTLDAGDVASDSDLPNLESALEALEAAAQESDLPAADDLLAPVGDDLSGESGAADAVDGSDASASDLPAMTDEDGGDSGDQN